MDQGELEKEVLEEYRKLMKVHEKPSKSSLDKERTKAKKESGVDKEERQRIKDIMAVPIKATSTKLYYLAQDRQKIRKLLNGGIL